MNKNKEEKHKIVAAPTNNVKNVSAEGVLY